MKRNEKILAGVLGLFVAGYVLRGPVMALTVDPVRELERERDSKFARSEGLGDQKFQLMVAKRRVDANRARSLPADVSDAERLYPQWLSDMAALSGLSEVQTTVMRVGSKRGEEFRPVKVELKARGRTDEIDAFLRRFAETDLLHRVNAATVSSPSATGDVDLSVNLEAEAVSLPTATDRNALFPLAELTAPLPADGTEATLAAPTDPVGRFPTEPGFTVRAGRELLTVTAIDRAERAADDDADADAGDGEPVAETWTVTRAVDGTDAEDHAAGAFLQLWPRIEDDGDRLALSETGPFRKPRTYEPRLNLDGPTRLVRGDEFRLKATAIDYDERAGDVTFAVADAPAGLALDPNTGELTWDPPEDLEAGEFTVKLTAAVPKPDVTLEETLSLTLAERNTPPTVEEVEPQTVSAGDVLLFDVTAGDAEDPDGVRLSLLDPPDGATIDADFGVVRWAVPEDADLGAKTLTVRATDAGDPPLETDRAVAVEVREDLRPFVKFVGSLGEKPTRRAWMFNQAENANVYLRTGDPFEIAGVSGEIREIANDTLLMERNDRLYRLQLGQSLAQAADVGPANGEPDAAVEATGDAPAVDGGESADAAAAEAGAAAADIDATPEVDAPTDAAETAAADLTD